MKKHIFYKRHRDDEWFDEIRIMGLDDHPIIKIVTIPRYKTSGLSGDEWRTSAQALHYHKNKWERLDRPVMNLEAASMALYGSLYSGYPHLHSIPTAYISFIRKGRLLYKSDYDGKPLSLLHCIGHLPWALVLAGENVVADYAWERQCFQPGCANIGVSTYELKKQFSRSGDELPQSNQFIFRRRFCKRHLRRGDAGLEDADDNYTVIEGPGPDEAAIWEQDVSEAIFGGIIDLT